MSKEYPLEIITPSGKFFDDKVYSISAPGVEGSFGVYAGHTPFLSLLKKGFVKIVKSDGNAFFALNSGVLEVNPQSHVLILADKILECATEEEARRKSSAEL